MLARICIFAMLFLIVSCQGTEVVKETGRTRPRLQYSEEEMAILGAQAYEEVTRDYKVNTGTPEAEMVERVGRRIADGTGKGNDSNYQWEFKLLEAPQTINAFCLPGGKVAVFTGILPVAKDEDGLAVILGHETAHATLQHGNERMSQRRHSRGSLACPSALAPICGGAFLPAAVGSSWIPSVWEGSSE